MDEIIWGVVEYSTPQQITLFAVVFQVLPRMIQDRLGFRFRSLFGMVWVWLFWFLIGFIYGWNCLRGGWVLNPPTTNCICCGFPGFPRMIQDRLGFRIIIRLFEVRNYLRGFWVLNPPPNNCLFCPFPGLPRSVHQNFFWDEMGVDGFFFGTDSIRFS